jgi:hypothetical protein
MADPGHWTASTTNEAVVIANLEGRKVPDRYATGDDMAKMGTPHFKRIHDPYERYGSDSIESDPKDCC